MGPFYANHQLFTVCGQLYDTMKPKLSLYAIYEYYSRQRDMAKGSSLDPQNYLLINSQAIQLYVAIMSLKTPVHLLLNNSTFREK